MGISIEQFRSRIGAYDNFLKTKDASLRFKDRYWNIIMVRTGPGKPGKSWNFILAFSRTGKSWKKATGPGKSWKSVKSAKKYEVYGGQ